MTINKRDCFVALRQLAMTVGKTRFYRNEGCSRMTGENIMLYPCKKSVKGYKLKGLTNRLRANYKKVLKIVNGYGIIILQKGVKILIIDL